MTHGQCKQPRRLCCVPPDCDFSSSLSSTSFLDICLQSVFMSFRLADPTFTTIRFYSLRKNRTTPLSVTRLCTSGGNCPCFRAGRCQDSAQLRGAVRCVSVRHPSSLRAWSAATTPLLLAMFALNSVAQSAGQVKSHNVPKQPHPPPVVYPEDENSIFLRILLATCLTT